MQTRAIFFFIVHTRIGDDFAPVDYYKAARKSSRPFCLCAGLTKREAARALVAGHADAACMIDGNHLLFITEGTLSSNAARIFTQTEPYDHCNFTAGPSAPREMIEPFRELLLGRSYADAEVRPLMDIEGLKSWREGRTKGYRALDRAVDEEVFYDRKGRITIPNYRY